MGWKKERKNIIERERKKTREVEREIIQRNLPEAKERDKNGKKKLKRAKK